jgi:hypothetical protein
MIKIFPPLKTYPFFRRNNSDKNEHNKISYWLSKLYKQEEKNTHGDYSRIQGLGNGQVGSLTTDQFLRKEGKDEQTKNQAKKKESDKQTVSDLIKMSNRCIFSVSTEFPWNFPPNTIDIEEDKVIFTFRQFLSFQSHSISIKDISNVFIESSFFYAALQIVSYTYIQNEIKIVHLNRKKADKARKIIEGLRTFIEHNINTSNYSVDELIAKIEEFHMSKKA